MDAKTRDNKVEFDNKAIESFESEFSFKDNSGQLKWRKHKYTAVDVAKNSCLKGLKIFQTRNNKDKWKNQTLEAIGDHCANDPLNAGIDIFGGVDSKKVKEDK